MNEEDLKPWEYIVDEEEEECCVEGFTEDEWCNPEQRLGTEHCEFLCPFGRIDMVYEEQREREA